MCSSRGPIDKRPNTWAVRYGDAEWKHYWISGGLMTATGDMERLSLHTRKARAA
jgi:hypothetical protein